MRSFSVPMFFATFYSIVAKDIAKSFDDLKQEMKQKLWDLHKSVMWTA